MSILQLLNGIIETVFPWLDLLFTVRLGVNLDTIRAKWPETVQITAIVGNLLVWMLGTGDSTFIRCLNHLNNSYWYGMRNVFVPKIKNEINNWVQYHRVYDANLSLETKWLISAFFWLKSTNLTFSFFLFNKAFLLSSLFLYSSIFFLFFNLKIAFSSSTYY